MHSDMMRCHISPLGDIGFRDRCALTIQAHWACRLRWTFDLLDAPQSLLHLALAQIMSIKVLF